MYKVPDDIVMEAVAAVISQVPLEHREPLTKIMAQICDIQYQTGYRDATKKAAEELKALV